MAEFQPLIMFGDGSQALYYQEKMITTNRHDIKVLPILLIPEKKIMERYGLTKEDLNIVLEDDRTGIWMEYPEECVTWLNRSRGGAVLFVVCAFDGSRTKFMDRYDELLEYHQVRDKTESRLRAEVSTLLRENEDISTQYANLVKKHKELAEIPTQKEEESGED